MSKLFELLIVNFWGFMNCNKNKDMERIKPNFVNE